MYQPDKVICLFIRQPLAQHLNNPHQPLWIEYIQRTLILEHKEHAQPQQYGRHMDKELVFSGKVCVIDIE